MGVRGLENYLENRLHSGCCKVDIKDEILKYRKETGQAPKIVIDGMSVAFFLYTKKLPWISGGQFKEFSEEAVKFIKAFTDIGAELIFFDGVPALERREHWKQRRYQRLKELYLMFDELLAGTDAAQINRKMEPYLPLNIISLLRSTVSCNGCKVISSLVECDREVARYASRNNCLAVLAQDSDFVIYEGVRNYWSMKHFDLNLMTTMNYNRMRLVQILGITPQLLPILATLIGNRIVPFESTLDFKIQVTRNRSDRNTYVPLQRCIHSLGSYVQSFPTGAALYDNLEEIADNVFIKESLLLHSLQSYNIDFEDAEIPSSGNKNWDSIVQLSREKHVNSDFPSSVYTVIAEQRFWSSTGPEDFRETDLPPALQILRNLRQHIYGILLHEKPLQKDQVCHEVKELVLTGPNSLDRDEIVTSHPCTAEHPGLRVLWSDSLDVSIKWALVGAAVQIDAELIVSLPSHLVVPSLALAYLLKQQLDITKWERDAILSSAVTLEESTVNYLHSLPIMIHETRSIRLRTIFSRACSAIVFLLHSCGSPLPLRHILPTNYEDGKLFHLKYTGAKNGSSVSELCNNKVNNVETFNRISNFIDEVISTLTGQ